MWAKILAWVSSGATGAKPFSRVTLSPLTGKLAQVNIDSFPQTSLGAARLKLRELKLLRQPGRCPATELKKDKIKRAIAADQVNPLEG